MKKLFTLLTAIFVYTTVSAQVLYSTEFKTQEEFDQWTVINANGDEKTWMFDDWASPSYVFYPYHSSNKAEDWLISPAIKSEESGSLAISYTVQGSSYTELLEVYVGNEPTIEAMKKVGETLILDVVELKSFLNLVEVKANEPIYVAFKACSDADKWRLYICNVKVQFTNNPVDIQVSEVVSPESGFGLAQETVTVKVKNVGNTAVNAFDLTLEVNEVVVATEKVNQELAVGAEMEYTFTAKADLSTPRQSHLVKVWTTHADDINSANDASWKVVLHKAPATVPYFMGFESNEYTDGISLFNLNNDSGNWEVYTDAWWNLAHTGYYCLAYNYDKNNNGDDWAILEPIEIKEAGYYALKFWYSGDDTHPEKLGVYYGNAGSPESMTNKIVEYAPFARGDYEESINIIKIDEPQTIYIGFHAFSDKDENWLCVDDVSLTKIESDQVDLGVSEIVNPDPFVHKGSKLSANFVVRNYGISDVLSVIRVKIDEKVISEVSTTIKAQEVLQLSAKDALKDLAAGDYSMTVEVVAENDGNLENNSKSVNFKVMGTPAMRWDFEDCILPKDFTFRAEDSGTVNPSAGSELNEEGWGLFSIVSHEQFGEYVLAGTSWLDGTDQADRWCILPPFIASENAYLVWDVASFNPSFLESYSIMVSSNGDDSWWYFTEKEFKSESADFKTRGVSLSYYSGREIYVAFRIRSKNCEHLILDNIELHGDITTGVEEVGTVSAANIKVSENAITVVGVEASAIELFDMSGASVASVAGNEVSTEGLAAGVYAVRVTTANNVITQKVVVK